MAFGPEIGTNSIVVPETETRTKQAPKPAEPAARPESAPEQALEFAPNGGGKFGKNLVYSRRAKVIPESIHVQESNLPSLHEVTVSNPRNSNNSNEFILENSEAQSQGDHTLFIKHSISGGVTILLVYVDDIIITGDDKEEQQMLSQRLATKFEIKTLGRLKYFLGIEVVHSKKGIFISQQKYITDLLKETGKTACKPASTPIDPNIELGSAEEDNVADKEMYQRLVGRLIYLSHTRPDIAFAVSLVSQFMHQPKEAHLQAALRIVQYLKGTLGRGILFKRNKSVRLEAYTDADYAESVVDRRSTTGYCTFLGGNLVTWKSKKQSVVARSSDEAEFRAMAQGICELLWLKIILEDFIAHNPVQHDRTKHIEVDRHFIKEKLDNGLICTPYVSTQSQLADILTKGLNCGNFERIISKLGMENIYSPA
ncbi:uncharacterized mitochondrial protein AtMg00810-like [Phaseolus vulgaris]|uniref:uncharacterized mitochondrial protein AtMg00810-like n=1 Tax=Phaseolus vulgaris TaxID=3885 RepID=UPI0035CB2838